MTDEINSLSNLWTIRNAAALTLGLTEDQMQLAIRAASVKALVGLLDSFSPTRSGGPEWSRTFEQLLERLWAWRDDATMAALADVYRARGMPWASFTNALSPENGVRLRDTIRNPAWARLPAFGLR